jgi:hypothetical protein
MEGSGRRVKQVRKKPLVARRLSVDMVMVVSRAAKGMVAGGEYRRCRWPAPRVPQLPSRNCGPYAPKLRRQKSLLARCQPPPPRCLLGQKGPLMRRRKRPLVRRRKCPLAGATLHCYSFLPQLHGPCVPKLRRQNRLLLNRQNQNQLLARCQNRSLVQSRLRKGAAPQPPAKTAAPKGHACRPLEQWWHRNRLPKPLLPLRHRIHW